MSNLGGAILSHSIDWNLGAETSVLTVVLVNESLTKLVDNIGWLEASLLAWMLGELALLLLFLLSLLLRQNFCNFLLVS